MSKLTKMNNRPSIEEFFIHYKAIMPSVLDLSENKIVNHIKVFRKLSNVKNNTPVLKFLLKNLDKYKLKAHSDIVSIDADLIASNLLEAIRLEVKITEMLESIKENPTWLN